VGNVLICRGVPPWAPSSLKIELLKGTHGGTPLPHVRRYTRNFFQNECRSSSLPSDLCVEAPKASQHHARQDFIIGYHGFAELNTFGWVRETNLRSATD
jgi:hypothetical protein